MSSKTAKICKNVTKRVCKEVSVKKNVIVPKKVSKKTSSEPKKTSRDAKKTSRDAKKTSRDGKKTSRDAKKTSRDAKKSSKTAKVSSKISSKSKVTIVNENINLFKKSKIKNKILAAIAAAGLLGIGYVKVIAPILEKSRLAKEAALLALSAAKTEEEKKIAEQEYAKRDNLLQIQESIGNEIIEKESSPGDLEESRPSQEPSQGTTVPQFNTLEENQGRKEEAFRRQQEIIRLKREAYKENVANYVERNKVRAEYGLRREEAKRAVLQKNAEARQLALQARNSAFQRLSQINKDFAQKALESKIAEEYRKIYAKRAQESIRISAEKAEESRRISAERAEESRRISAERAEESRRISVESAKKAEESRRISAERAAESRRASLQKIEELRQRASSKSAELRESLGRKALGLKQILSSRLNSPRPSNSQLPRYTTLEQQALVQAQASAAAVSSAVANLPIIAETPKIVPEILENRVEAPTSITGIFKELVVASPVNTSFPSPATSSNSQVVDRDSRRRGKKAEALNSGPCSKAEEQSLRDKSRKLSFGSNNFSKRIGECGISGIKGISIDGEYFECISGPSGAQEMKEEYLDSINNLIIKAKVCSDKRVKNENSIYFENIRNAKPKVKDY